MKEAVSKAFMIGVTIALLSCQDDDDNYLKGSITDSYDMDFDETRIRQYESELSIEYVVKSEETEKVALRVTLNLSSGPPVQDQVYDLTTQGTISRGPGFGSELPDLESGELKLTKYSSQDGSDVKGEFNAVFQTSDQKKKTLYGGFSAELEIVD
jgi:hypothetical protein